MVRNVFTEGGSSPLARGTQEPGAFSTYEVRLIPARAGNTTTTRLAALIAAAHPRSRGEHHQPPVVILQQFGSSPLARGTHRLCRRGARRPRLIPARAGNTFHASANHHRRAAHPRSRGEHAGRGYFTLAPCGSSPLARGTHEGFVVHRLVFRLIPARAGNTGQWLPCTGYQSAHPRSRGEHATELEADMYADGSSPLARGTHFQLCFHNMTPRLIPARAGNTVDDCEMSEVHPAHPRSRGEHAPPIRIAPMPHGSSPLARGTPVSVVVG